MGGKSILRDLRYHVIGLMSGTSLDGLDIAYCEISRKNGEWSFHLIGADTLAYSADWRNRLVNSIHMTSEELLTLDIDYGRFLGEKVCGFMKDVGANPDFIASHGHTIFHQPEKGWTLQIGKGQEIANATGIKTICDFRSKDVSLGGQGAPLVPVGDEYFFSKYDACLNLGGIGNVSFKKAGVRTAMDICAVNMLLNYLTLEIGKAYDHGGTIARSGVVISDLLERLNGLPYFAKQGPKSTGVEWFNHEVVPVLEEFSTIPLPDRLRTALEHIAIQISHSVTESSSMLVTGGGAKNSFLMERLAHWLGFEPYIPDQEIVDFKEALVFALMGVLRNEEEINCFKSVTGARSDNSGGVVYLPS